MSDKCYEIHLHSTCSSSTLQEYPTKNVSSIKKYIFSDRQRCRCSAEVLLPCLSRVWVQRLLRHWLVSISDGVHEHKHSVGQTWRYQRRYWFLGDTFPLLIGVMLVRVKTDLFGLCICTLFHPRKFLILINGNTFTGESYGGVYVPTLVDALITELKKEVNFDDLSIYPIYFWYISCGF